MPLHLHEHLGIDRNELHKEVRPSWKLGLRFEWGAMDVPHFNDTFDRYLNQRIVHRLSRAEILRLRRGN